MPTHQTETKLVALAERIAYARTLAFIGAGCSAWSGFPLWGGLLELLHAHAKRYELDVPAPSAEIDNRVLAEIYADVLRSRAGGIGGAVQQALAAQQGATPSELHDRLVRLPFSHFITTNYDALLEKACEDLFEREGAAAPAITKSGRSAAHFSDFLANLAEDRRQRTVLHLHGLLNDDLTLAMSDYDDQYLGDSMTMRMSAVLSTSTLVFVGNSLTDQDLMDQVRRTNFHGGRVIRHFAFLPWHPHAPVHAESLRTTYGIETIWYETRDGSHRNLLQKLDRLQELVDASRPGPQRERATCNHAPVVRDLGHEESAGRIEEAVGMVKEAIRSRRSSIVVIDGLDERHLSWILRRLVRDYRLLPGPNHFRYVIWLSEAVLGLMPSAADRPWPRTPFQAVAGELAQTLGLYRVNTSESADDTIHAVRRVLAGADGATEPTLIVADELPGVGLPGDGQASDRDGRRTPLERLLFELPKDSVFVYARPNADDAVGTPGPGTAPVPGTDGGALSVDLSEYAEDFRAAWDATMTMTTRATAALLDRLDELLANQTRLRQVTLDVLAGMSVVSTGTTSAALASMLGEGQDRVRAALKRLAEADLVEQLPTGALAGSPPWPKEIALRSAVRRAILSCALPGEDHALARQLTDALDAKIEDFVGWALDRLNVYKRWEHDESERGDMLARLGDVVAIWEVAVWRAEHTAAAAGTDPRDELDPSVLELCSYLVDVFLSLGRCGEAVDMLRWLVEMAGQAEPFHTEGLILRARRQAVLGRTFYELNDGMLCAAAVDGERTVLQPEGEIPPGMENGREATEKKPKHTMNRFGSERQRQRATVEHAHLGIKLAELRRASSVTSGPAEDLKRTKDEARQLLLKIDGMGELVDPPEDRADLFARLEDIRNEPNCHRALFEAAGHWVRATGLDRRSTAEDEPEQLRRDRYDQLTVLKAVEHALGPDRNRRLRGFHAWVRGQVLRQAGNTPAARRAYARAYTLAIEYRDTLLEANARLGLAICDRRQDLADEAADLFASLHRPERRRRAVAAALELSRYDLSATDLGRPPHPRLVVVGGGGNGGPVRTAALVHERLATWGFACRPLAAETGEALIKRLAEMVEDESLPHGSLHHPDGVPRTWFEALDVVLARIPVVEDFVATMDEAHDRADRPPLKELLGSVLVLDAVRRGVHPLDDDHPELAHARCAYRTLDVGLDQVAFEEMLDDQLALSFADVDRLRRRVVPTLSEGATADYAGVSTSVARM